MLDIPVFHDDQHGTAIVVMAALFNSLKIIGKPIESLRVVMLGLGAAGIACTKMMVAAGVTDIIGCDRRGAISTARDDYEADGMPAIKRWFAETTNPEKIQGGPNDVLEGADLFIGLSGPGLVDAESLAGDEPRRDRLRDGQPDARGDARGRRPVTSGSWPRAAPTTRIRSTTSSPSPASSAARSTPVHRRSPRR